LLNKSLTLSGLQGVCSMGCLLHLLCESATPNNGMQPTAQIAAADAGRYVAAELQRGDTGFGLANQIKGLKPSG